MCIQYRFENAKASERQGNASEEERMRPRYAVNTQSVMIIGLIMWRSPCMECRAISLIVSMTLCRILDCDDICPVRTPRKPLSCDKLDRIRAEKMHSK